MPVTKRGFQLEDALTFLGAAATQVFTQCQMGECTKHSLGIVCTHCSRAVCQRHAYVTASVPPRPICCSCIMEEHRELWDEDDEHFREQEPPRRETRREQQRPPREEPRQARRDDGPVIDVEFESMGGGGGRRR